MTERPQTDDELFRFATAPAPYQKAVELFCQDSGKSLTEIEQLTPHQIFERVREHYGEDLSEFWRIWKDWHSPEDVQPTGDL